MSNTRDYKTLSPWASDAETEVPAGGAVPGISYRSESTDDSTSAKGQAFKRALESGSFNQIFYLATKLLAAVESNGVLGWCDLVDYPVNAFSVGSDGALYSALQASGPASTAVDPVGDTSNTWIDYLAVVNAAIADNASDISDNIDNIAINAQDIAGNSSAITAVEQSAAANANAINLTNQNVALNAGAIADNASDISDNIDNIAINAQDLLDHLLSAAAHSAMNITASTANNSLSGDKAQTQIDQLDSKAVNTASAVVTLAETIGNLAGAQGQIANQSEPVFNQIPQVETEVPFSVEVPSTNDEVLEFDNGFIILKKDIAYNFLTDAFLAINTGSSRDITFIMRDEFGALISSRTLPIEDSNNDKDQFVSNNLITVGSNGIPPAPLKLKLFMLCSGNDIELTKYISLIASAASVDVNLGDGKTQVLTKDDAVNLMVGQAVWLDATTGSFTKKMPVDPEPGDFIDIGTTLGGSGSTVLFATLDGDGLLINGQATIPLQFRNHGKSYRAMFLGGGWVLSELDSNLSDLTPWADIVGDWDNSYQESIVGSIKCVIPGTNLNPILGPNNEILFQADPTDTYTVIIEGYSSAGVFSQTVKLMPHTDDPARKNLSYIRSGISFVQARDSVKWQPLIGIPAGDLYVNGTIRATVDVEVVL